MDTNFFSVVLPVFVSLMLGILCRKIKLLDQHAVTSIRNLALDIMIPFINVKSFLQADYSPMLILIAAWVFIACFLALVIGRKATKLAKIPYEQTPYLCTCFEGGMMGFTLYPLLYGTAGPYAMLSMGQIIFIYSIYKANMMGVRKPLPVLREALKCSAIWGMLLGIGLKLSGIHDNPAFAEVRTVFLDVLEYVSGPTSFLILLTIGYDFELKGIPWKYVLRFMGIRYGIMACLLAATLLLNHLVFGNTIVTSAAVLMYILPPPYIVSVLSDKPEEAGFLSSTLTVTTIFTLIGFAVMTAVKI